MTRKLVWIGLPYGAALFLASCCTVPVWSFAAIPVLLLFLRVFFRAGKTALLTGALSFAVGCGIYCAYDALQYRPLLAYDGQTVALTGTIAEVRYGSSDQATYEIKTTLGGISTTVSYYGTACSCEVGDTITMQATLSTYTDSYLFPAATYYKSEHRFLSVEHAEQVALIPAHTRSPLRLLYRYRDSICEEIRSAMSSDSAALLLAMLFGEKSGLEESTQTALYRTGIGHVTAVSGLHLTILCSVLAHLLTRLRIRRGLQFFLLAFVMLLFALCADASMSVLRACVMLLLIYSAQLFVRCADTLNSLCLALLLLTCTQPFAIRNPSLLLSMSGVFAVGVVAPYLTGQMPVQTRTQRFFRNFVQMCCVSAALIPVSVLYFDEISLIAPLANLLLLPVCVLALLCGLCVVMTGGFLASPCLLLAELCCRLVLHITVICGRLSVSYLSVSASLVRLMVGWLALAVLLGFLLTHRRRVVALSLLLSVLILLSSVQLTRLFRRNTLQIAVLGQLGACALVVTESEKTDVFLLAGGSKTADYVAAYLGKQGISEIQTLVLANQPYSAMRAYESTLCYLTVHAVLLAENVFVLDGATICGCIPQRVSFEATSLQYPDYAITLTEQGTVSISYGGNEFLCRKSTAQLSTAPNVLVQYGNDLPEVLVAEYLIVTDDAPLLPDAQTYVGENNLLVFMHQSGEISVKRLME